MSTLHSILTAANDFLAHVPMDIPNPDPVQPPGTQGVTTLMSWLKWIGYAVVGGQLPPATGAALAISYRAAPGPASEAVMCLLGDATTNIGAFHEALNLAAVWHLPIVYVIVNN